MNGAAVIAEILKREGTEFLSCYPRNPLIEASAALDIRPILCRQERVGVGIADGYSRIKRGKRNGVFAAQAGPGIENAFPGVAQAFSENVPLLVIAGGMPLGRQYVRPVFRAANVFQPVTKWSALAHSVQELPGLLRRAYHAMRSGKAGPVLIEVPDEVFTAEYQGPLDYAPVSLQRAAPDPAAVKKAAEMLLAAKQPLLWAGQGVHYAEASEQLAALAELLPAPVVATNPGKSAIADSHPLALGAATRSRSKMFADFMSRADLILAIGSSLTVTNFGPAVPPSKTIIHSSNDPSDINKEYRADHALVGDAALVIDALITELSHRKSGSGDNTLAALKADIAAGKKAWLDEWSKHLSSDEIPINQYRVIRDLMRTLDRDNVIITHDSGSPREQLLPFWETTGQVDPAWIRARHHYGRQTRSSEKIVCQRDGRRRNRHDRHGHRDGGSQSHRHPHRRLQQRSDGGRARRAKTFDQEVRRSDCQRQLRQGGRGTQRRLDTGREARRDRTRDQGCGRRHGNRCTVSARIRRQGRLRLLALLLNDGG